MRKLFYGLVAALAAVPLTVCAILMTAPAVAAAPAWPPRQRGRRASRRGGARRGG